MTKSNVKTLLEYLFKEAPEASVDSIYGKYLFAPDREDLKPKEKSEINEPVEDELKDALASWYEGGGSHGLEDQIDWIIDAIESGEYKKILSPPKNKKVYRWLGNLNPETAANILQTSLDNIIVTGGVPTVVNVQNILPSKYSDFQSWTTNLDALPSIVINDLGDGTQNDDKVAMILESNTKLGTFLINPKGVQNVKGLPSYAYKQDEVISYQEVHVTRAAFIYLENIVQTKYFISDLIDLIKK